MEGEQEPKREAESEKCDLITCDWNGLAILPPRYWEVQSAGRADPDV